MALKTLRYTLVADGPSDAALLQVIDWALDQARPPWLESTRSAVFDGRIYQEPPSGLANRIAAAIRDNPCDLMFVHRDAERDLPGKRLREIEEALVQSSATVVSVPIVPIRMTEAWLLIDPVAICRAADNPSFAERLELPAIRGIEQLPNPKEVLRQYLLQAANLSGQRRRQQFKRRLSRRMHRVAGLIRDFSVLRQLSAYRAFEGALAAALAELEADPSF